MLEYGFFIAFAIVTGAVYIWPQALLVTAGPGALWAVIGSILLGFGMNGLGLLWLHWSPKGILVDRLRPWGPLRWPILALHALLCLGLDAALVALLAQMLAAVFYPQTPLWLMESLVIGLAGWFASQPLATLARNLQFWFPLLAATFFLLISLNIGHLHQTWAWRPGPWPGLSVWGRAVLGTWFLWKQNEVMLTVAPFVRPPQLRVIRRVTWIALGFQAIVLVVIYGTTVGTLGPQAVQLLRWPLVYVLSNLSSHTFYLSRPGLLILVTWTGAMVFFVSTHLFCTGLNVSRLLTHSYRASPVVVSVSSALIALAAFAITTPTQATNLVMEIFNPIDLSFSAIVVLVSLGLTHLAKSPNKELSQR